MDRQAIDGTNLTTTPAADRVKLATFRTHLALERTTLAWIRTTLTMASFGFGMVAFFRTLRQANQSPETTRLHEAAISFGVSLVALGIAATVLAGLLHLLSVRRLQRGEPLISWTWPLSVTVGMLLAVLGLWGLWSLLAR